MSTPLLNGYKELFKKDPVTYEQVIKKLQGSNYTFIDFLIEYSNLTKIKAIQSKLPDENSNLISTSIITIK